MYNTKKNWWKDPITKAQLEYIRILSSYPSTRKKDRRVIKRFIRTCGKKNLKELTKKEASDLIQILLQRPVTYELLCGKRVVIDKQTANKYNLFGEMEACLHECNVDIHSCEHWKRKMKEEEELARKAIEEELKEISIKILHGEKIDSPLVSKCFVCGRYFIENKEDYGFVVETCPEVKDKIFLGRIVRHHIDYESDKTILVCDRCHAKIHHSNEYNEFKPKNKPTQRQK